jgi:hypothetical protein
LETSDVRQRGNRKVRKRCGYVDPTVDLRCRRQVNRAGATYCSPAHATASRPKATRNTAPGARARHHAAQEATRQRLTAALQLLANDQGWVPLLVVLQMLMDTRTEGYASGYAAGHRTGRQQAHALRLESSRAALDEFIGSRFGKSFIAGTLQPERLATFSFKKTRR